jgi:hypothetical protein
MIIFLWLGMRVGIIKEGGSQERGTRGSRAELSQW